MTARGCCRLQPSPTITSRLGPKCAEHVSTARFLSSNGPYFVSSTTRRGRSLFRHQDDFDPAVLGPALRRRVVGHRLELGERGGGEGGRLDTLLLEIAGNVDRARGRELPVGRIALRERADDRLVVRVPLDADRSVVHRLEDLDHLAEDYEPVGLHFRLARIEEDRFDHVDGELALQLGDRHLSLVDLALHLRDELLVGRADLAHLLLARLLRLGEVLREPGVVALERADALAQVGDALAELARFHRQGALQLGPVGRQLLVALAGVCELAFETRVLCVERVIARLGRLNGLGVLALRDASGGAERNESERGDPHDCLAHLWSPRSENLAKLPAIHYCKSRPLDEELRPVIPFPRELGPQQREDPVDRGLAVPTGRSAARLTAAGLPRELATTPAYPREPLGVSESQPV